MKRSKARQHKEIKPSGLKPGKPWQGCANRDMRKTGQCLLFFMRNVQKGKSLKIENRLAAAGAVGLPGRENNCF